jgi:hypothetical protein
VSFPGSWLVFAIEMPEHKPMTSMAMNKAEFVRVKAAPIANSVQKVSLNRSTSTASSPVAAVAIKSAGKVLLCSKEGPAKPDGQSSGGVTYCEG